MDSRGQAEDRSCSILYSGGDKESTSYSGNEQQIGSLVTMETRKGPHPSLPLRLNTLMGQSPLLCYLKWPENEKIINKRVLNILYIYPCILNHLVVSRFL